MSFVTLGLAACAHTIPSESRADIFVLMGQSNMSGRGELSQLPADYQNPDPRITVYGNDGIVRVAQEPVDSAQGQLDVVSADPMAGVGPALAFAKRRLELRPNTRILLVPCAKGGTSIDAWQRSAERSTLYGSCLARVREISSKGRVAGLLWYQGESDTSSLSAAAAWSAKFKAGVNSFREDIGAPDAPVINVGLGDIPLTGRSAGMYSPEAWRMVQEAQQHLELTNYLYVSAAGLAKNPDDLHLNTASALAIGRRMADAMEPRR